LGQRQGALESLEVTVFGGVYRERRVLLTGHTGFKGSWLALWLQKMGARVTGLSLEPQTNPSHWSLLSLDMEERRLDIRDAALVAGVIRDAAPEIVFHLAAQALVRRSYRDPLQTWSTNVMGTANILEACRHQPSVRAVVVVTTDKCYQNREWEWSYREIDPLGGHDPYSASKAGVELLVSSYRSSFFQDSDGALIATARAGNVIGGGDWSEDRLIADLARSVERRVPLQVRFPNATRPWQHVLEPLAGYLLLGQKLLEGKREFADACNFGPDAESNRTVGEVLRRLQTSWPGMSWELRAEPQPHEAHLLQLDSTKARLRLQWRPVWNLDQGLAATAEWYRSQIETGEVLTRRQLDAYCAAAAREAHVWCLQ
jgi:CDP-glucose 4,6-dehydratase